MHQKEVEEVEEERAEWLDYVARTGPSGGYNDVATWLVSAIIMLILIYNNNIIIIIMLSGRPGLRLGQNEVVYRKKKK